MLQTEKQIKLRSFSDLVVSKFDAFGTEIELRIVVNGSDKIGLAKKHLEQAREMYEYFTKIFSRFDAESELAKLNGKLGIFSQVSIEMLEATQHCLKFNTETNGIFDPRIIGTLEAIGYKEDFKKGKFVLCDDRQEKNKAGLLEEDLKIKDKEVFFGARMDFTGIVKGLVTDKVSKLLLEKGWGNFLVNSGGDMFLSGCDQNGNVWCVDVDGIPHEKIMFALSENGLATSGISKRKWEIAGQKFHHLINPKKPDNFLFNLKTVTIVADSTEKADVWAKTLFLMGREDAILYARENDLAAVILDYRGSAWISPKAKGFLYQ